MEHFEVDIQQQIDIENQIQVELQERQDYVRNSSYLLIIGISCLTVMGYAAYDLLFRLNELP
jgi:hypothetical protein